MDVRIIAGSEEFSHKKRHGCEDNCRCEEFSRVKRRGRLAEM